ncbi:GNAT family N-acetyltransferase [Amycolatopsis sp. H20-H5]|uniref:GNAT family N-acetyltransferase n=1 Tax=Amycolatopsis sp. H20-H5 TaxID=3046309 RepID=UPI002DBF1189|nr:GNAT family N-acetyltransferase [Amycolatopsis sp. H20-H5]MEC3977815.1 GNAT family N-acetyltransferase [Amycolatopsis sp. H20-H5]
MTDFDIRHGGSGDYEALLGMFDDAVAWLVERGSAGQWGTEPFSAVPRQVARVRGMVDGEDLYIAEVDGVPAGALVLGARSEDIPAVAEPEVYVRLLITSRKFGGHRVGARLIEFTLAEAGRQGVDLVRVDCWAGGDGSLVRYYQGQGFAPTVRFDVKGWTGQVLEQRVG